MGCGKRSPLRCPMARNPRRVEKKSGSTVLSGGLGRAPLRHRCGFPAAGWSRSAFRPAALHGIRLTNCCRSKISKIAPTLTPFLSPTFAECFACRCSLNLIHGVLLRDPNHENHKEDSSHFNQHCLDAPAASADQREQQQQHSDAVQRSHCRPTPSGDGFW